MNLITKEKLDKLKTSFNKVKNIQLNHNTNHINIENSFLILQENGFLINEEKKFEIFSGVQR